MADESGAEVLDWFRLFGASNLAKRYGPEHERATLAFIGNIPESSLNAAEAARLSDIRAGKYDTTGQDWIDAFTSNKGLGALSALAIPAGLSLAGVGAGGAAVGSGGAAGAGAAETGLAAELAAGAPELAGTMGLSSGAAATGAGMGLSASGSPLMPAAIPPTDPTFGGILTQTGAGQFENLANIGAFGGSLGSGAALAPTTGGGILGSGITGADLLRGLPGLIGAGAAKSQADDYNRLANAYMNFGAPSRQRFEASFAPDFSMENDPGYLDALKQAAKANAHALSAKHGNPYGNPNALMQSEADLYQRFAYPALQGYRQMNAGAGGLAQFASAAPQMANSAIQSQGNIFNALGGAAADIFNPPTPLEEAIRRMSKGLQGVNQYG